VGIAPKTQLSLLTHPLLLFVPPTSANDDDGDVATGEEAKAVEAEKESPALVHISAWPVAAAAAACGETLLAGSGGAGGNSV
jgi:hypothetical protein